MEIFHLNTLKIRLTLSKVITSSNLTFNIEFDEYCDKKYKADYLGLQVKFVD